MVSKKNNTYSKFEYFLNAVYYILYLHEVSLSKKIRKVVDMFFRISYLRILKKKHTKDDEKALNNYFYSKKGGVCIYFAEKTFSYLCLLYPAFIGLFFFGFYFRFVDKEIPEWGILLMAFFYTIIFSIPIDRAVFNNDRYLKYFKQFEKKDALWHKKWQRITKLFYLFAFISILFGLAVFWGITIYL